MNEFTSPKQNSKQSMLCYKNDDRIPGCWAFKKKHLFVCGIPYSDCSTLRINEMFARNFASLKMHACITAS